MAAHPHAFRHTIVGQLVDAGNPVELGSKYMGHADVTTTTANYWVPTALEVHDKMNNPFTGKFREPESEDTDERRELRLSNAKTRKLLEVVNHYNVVIGAIAERNGSASDVQEAILETSPGLPNLLRLLSASVCDDVPSEEGSESEEEDDESSSAGPSPAKRRRTDEGPTTVSQPSART